MDRTAFSPSTSIPPNLHERQSREQRKHDLCIRSLRRAVRWEITLAFAFNEKLRCREIADVVAEKYFADLDGCQSRLIRDALTSLVRKEVKQRGVPLFGKTRALRLPELFSCPNDSLPSAISVPTESSDSGDVFFHPLSAATLTELRRHLDLLSAQITADRRRFHALRELYESAIEAGAASDASIASRLAEQEID